MPDEPLCTCQLMDGKELLLAWRVRLLRVTKRRLARGRGVDPMRMAHVAGLCLLLDRGPDVCPEAWDRTSLASCHLPGCPWRRRGPPVQETACSPAYATA